MAGIKLLRWRMYYEHHRYVDKNCVVTGGANGLGLNLVNRLYEEGASRIVVLDLEGDTMAREYAGREIGRAHV